MEEVTAEALADGHVYDPLIVDFIEDCELRGFTRLTYRGYRLNLEQVDLALFQKSQKFVSQMEKDDLKAVLQMFRERGASQKRIENVFTSISSFYKFLVFHDHRSSNPVPAFREYYLRRYKKNGEKPMERKLLTIEEMRKLVRSVLDPRDKAILVLLAKTGIRIGELAALNTTDINWEAMTITLHPTAKRTNRVVFFDGETRQVSMQYRLLKLDEIDTAVP